MPKLVKTVNGVVSALWGKALVRKPDGTLQPLQLGDVVHAGDQILTAQDSVVQITQPDGTPMLTAGAAKPPAPQPTDDLNRVIAELENPDAGTAPGAGLGGGGDGSFQPGLRVDRISEATTAAAAGPVADVAPVPAPALPDANTVTTSTAQAAPAPAPAPAPNQAPSATPATLSGPEDSSLPVSLGGTDPDGAITAVTITALPANGTLVLADGTPVTPGQVLTPAQAAQLAFHPDANGTGSTTIQFTVTDDGGATSAPATVQISVTPVNDVPVAGDASIGTQEDTPVSGSVTATDVDGDTLTYGKGSDPAHGSVVVNPDGSFTYTPAPNYHGPDSFTVTVNDGHGGSTTSTVTLTVGAVNDAPVAANVALTTAEDTPVNGAVAASDVDGDTLSYSVSTAAQHGTVALNADGTFTYTPAANYNGPDSFVVTVSDGHGGVTTSTVSIGVTPVNDAPTTTAVALTTAEDTPVNGAVIASDIDGDTLAFSVTTAAQHGSVALNADGTFTYTPAAHYNGPDSFVVTVSDGHGGTTTSTVSIGVTPVNDAPVAANQTLTTAEDSPLTGNIGATDVDGDTLAYAVTTGVAHGSLVLDPATGAFTYTPAANYHGPDSFVVSVSDGHGGTATSTITIGVTPVNDAPVAANDLAFTTINTPLSSINVLANDSDVDGDTLSVTGATVAAAQGSVSVNPDGTLAFTPAANFSGAATITYTVDDGNGGSATATLTVNVGTNTPPAGTDATVTLLEDGQHTFSAASFGFSDADAGQSLAAVRIDALPAQGTLTLNGSAVVAGQLIPAGSLGALVFTPVHDANGSNYASLQFSVQDSAGSFDTTPNTITFDVTPVNDAPVAHDDSATTAINTPLASINVLGNDTDVDGDTLSVTGASMVNPAQGSVSVNPDGTLAFTPAANFSGPATITYTVSDGQGGSATATLTVNVGTNTPPAGTDATVTLLEDGSHTFSSASFGFSDADAGQSLAAVRIDALPAQGTLTLNGTAVVAGQLIAVADLGGLVFAPAANGNGNAYANLQFSVQDSAGGFDATPNTITFNVTPVNDAPVAHDDTATTAINTPLSSINVLGNDTDVDGDTLSVTGATVAAAQGSVSVNPDGTLAFTPAANFSGAATITYTVDDGHGGSATATLTVNVGTNTPPAGTDATVTLLEDGQHTFSAASFGFTDADAGQSLAAVRIDSLPAQGTLTLNGSAVVAGQLIPVGNLGTLVFTPVHDANGSNYASLQFSVQDSAGAFDTTPNTITFNVTPVNDAPVAHDDSATTAINTPLASINVLGNDTDVDGDTLSVTGASMVNPAQGSVSVNPDGTLAFTPAANFTGTAAINYTVSDGHGGSAIATLTVNVGGNTPPAGTDATVTLLEDGQHTFSAASFGFTDPDAGQSLAAVRIDALPAQGTLTLNGSAVVAGQLVAAADLGGLVFTPVHDANGSNYANLKFSVQDSAGAFDPTPNTITFNVTPVNDVPLPIVTAASGNEETIIGVTFAASDVDGTVTSFTVTALPANGTLMFNGSPVTVGTVVPATGGVAQLTFVPTHDWNGSTQVSFTATDNDGGVSNPGIVPITVTPVNDAPVVGTAAVALSEKALAGGTGGGSATASGTLSITDVDSSSFTVKLAAPSASLTSGGTALTWAVTNGGHTLTGTAGGNTIVTATITDTGAYTVTLSGPIDDSANSNDEAFTLPVSVTDVAGAGSSTTLSSLAVSVVDDAPVIGTPASAVLYNGTGVHAEGALNLAIGADSGGAAKVVFAGTQTDASGFIMATRTNNAGVVQGTGYLTFNGSKLTYTQNADGSLSAMAGSTEVYRVKGDLSTGHYTIDTLHTLDPVQINTAVFGSLTAGNNGSYSFSDGSNTFDLTVKAFGGTTPTVNTNNSLLGVNNQFIDTGERLSFDIASHGSANVTQVTAMNITANGLGSGETLTWTAYADAAHTIVAGSGTVAGSGSASSNNVDITIDTSKLNAGFNWFSGIEFGASGNHAKYQLALNSITGGSENLHQTTTISAFGRDADGDSTSTSSMSLTFNGNSSITGTGSADALAGGSAADTLVGGAGNDIIVGGAGADSLTGGTGADTFQWRLADKPASGVTTDTITDFNAASTASGGDQLDLRDLLQAEKGSTLDKYLDFQVSGSDTIIHVSSSGGFAAGTAWTAQSGAATATEDQRIVLSNVNLPSALGLAANATDQQIITELLNRGKLVVDNQGS